MTTESVPMLPGQHFTFGRLAMFFVLLSLLAVVAGAPASTGCC